MQTLSDAIAAHPNTLYIVAAGNGGNDQIGDNNDVSPTYPCALPQDNVLCVGASNSGDSIATGLVPKLMKEVDIVLHSSDILAESEKEFFGNMKLLCQASIETGNPILF